MIQHEIPEVQELRMMIEQKRHRLDYLLAQASSAADPVARELELLEGVLEKLEACTNPFHTEIAEMVNRKVDQMLHQPYARKLDGMVFYFHLRQPQGPMYYVGYGSNLGYMHTELRLETFIDNAIYRAKIVPLDILDEIERNEQEIEKLKRLRTGKVLPTTEQRSTDDRTTFYRRQNFCLPTLHRQLLPLATFREVPSLFKNPKSALKG